MVHINVAVLLMHGVQLKHEDHVISIDKDPENIALSNLKVANASEFRLARRLGVNNTTGFKNVCFYCGIGKFVAAVKKDNKVTKKYFLTLRDAVIHANLLRKQFAGEFAYDGVSPGGLQECVPTVEEGMLLEAKIREEAEVRMPEKIVEDIPKELPNRVLKPVEKSIVQNEDFLKEIVENFVLHNYARSGLNPAKFAKAASKVLGFKISALLVEGILEKFGLQPNLVALKASGRKAAMEARIKELEVAVKFMFNKLEDLL